MDTPRHSRIDRNISSRPIHGKWDGPAYVIDVLLWQRILMGECRSQDTYIMPQEHKVSDHKLFGLAPYALKVGWSLLHMKPHYGCIRNVNQIVRHRQTENSSF